MKILIYYILITGLLINLGVLVLENHKLKESQKLPHRVEIQLTDTCDYDCEILYWNANILVNGESTPTVLKMSLNDTIINEFRYGDGYMRVKLIDLICR